MSLRLINKLYKGCLIIWRDENFLLNEITVINEKNDIVNALIVNSNGEIISLTCNQKEFLESVVK